jgi:hypothetical protein
MRLRAAGQSHRAAVAARSKFSRCKDPRRGRLDGAQERFEAPRFSSWSASFTSLAEAIVTGPIGTGKTMSAIGLAADATRRRDRVLSTRAPDLVQAFSPALRTAGCCHHQFSFQRMGQALQ